MESIAMQVQTEKRLYTPEEYLALEENAEYKSEYHDGEIVPMTGGTTDHNIAGNVHKNLKLALRGQSYKVFFGAFVDTILSPLRLSRCDGYSRKTCL
jgi:Uma2 family endonuclease